MKAVLIALLAAAVIGFSVAQTEIHSANVKEWQATHDNTHYTFRDNGSCTVSKIPAEQRKGLSDGTYLNGDKQGKICWVIYGDTIAVYTDEKKAVVIPRYKVHPLWRT